MNPKLYTKKDLAYVFKGVKLKTPLFLHQAQVVTWALLRDRIALWLGIGTGKTYAALTIGRLWGCNRILVVAPNSVLPTWKQETLQHTDFRAVILSGTKNERELKLRRSDAHVFVINYEGLGVVFGKWQKYNDREGNEHKRRITNYDALKENKFDCVIFDECHHLKDGRAAQTGLAWELSRRAKKAMLLTGTPVATSLLDLWSEFFVLDSGRVLGTSYWKFRMKYFKEHGFNWKPKKDAKKNILDKIKENTVHYKRSDCIDLPDRLDEVRLVTLSEKQQLVYNKVRAGLKVKLGEGQLSKTNVLVQAGKLSQICGGSLILEGGKINRFKNNPKLKELLNVLEEVEGKCIVYHSFVEEGRIIGEALRKRGILYCAIRGEVKDKQTEIETFKNKKNVKVLLAHPKSGGEGLNLQCANVVIFYSTPYSALIVEQCEGRVFRAGQKDSCLFIRIVAENTIDMRIQAVVKNRGNVSQAILEYVRSG